MKASVTTELKRRNSYSERPIDIIDNPREYIIKIYMPEFDESDVSLKISGDMLEVTAYIDFTLGMEKRSNYERMFKLPSNSNTGMITARMRKDILNIRIPKIRLTGHFRPSPRPARAQN
jgi:HSP20 family molecular chaperone IbpA